MIESMCGAHAECRRLLTVTCAFTVFNVTALVTVNSLKCHCAIITASQYHVSWTSTELSKVGWRCWSWWQPELPDAFCRPSLLHVAACVQSGSDQSPLDQSQDAATAVSVSLSASSCSGRQSWGYTAYSTAIVWPVFKCLDLEGNGWTEHSSSGRATVKRRWTGRSRCTFKTLLL